MSQRQFYLPGERPGLDGDAVPLFQKQRYVLNSIGWNAAAAALAKLTYRLHRADCVERSYDNGPQAGYTGWIEHPRYGVLAYIREDGTLQFKW